MPAAEACLTVAPGTAAIAASEACVRVVPVSAAPPAINSLMIGIYFLSVFAGSLLVGWVGQFYEKMSAPAYWLLHSAAAGIAALIILALWKPLSRALMVTPI